MPGATGADEAKALATVTGRRVLALDRHLRLPNLLTSRRSEREPRPQLTSLSNSERASQAALTSALVAVNDSLTSSVESLWPSGEVARLPFFLMNSTTKLA